MAAIAIAVVIASHGGNRRALAGNGHWSSWAPDSSGSTGLSEIAQYISPYYRQVEPLQVGGSALVLTPLPAQ